MCYKRDCRKRTTKQTRNLKAISALIASANSSVVFGNQRSKCVSLGQVGKGDHDNRQGMSCSRLRLTGKRAPCQFHTRN